MTEIYIGDKKKASANTEYRTINMIGEQTGYHFSEHRQGPKTSVFLK